MLLARLDHVSQVLPMSTVHIRGWGFGRLPGVTFPTPPLGLEVPCMHNGLPSRMWQQWAGTGRGLRIRRVRRSEQGR